MPFDWNQYGNLAIQLSNDENLDEAKIRTAISRFYYAAFHLSKAAFNVGNPSGDGGSHEKVWEAIKRSRQIDCHKVADHGYRLKKLRRQADYVDVKIDNEDLIEARYEYDSLINCL